MSNQGQQRYTFEKLQSLTNEALSNKEMPNHLYNSVNSISKVLDAIITTNGKDWSAQVLNSKGEPLLSKEEQPKFQRAFKPYVNSIISFFDSNHIQAEQLSQEQEQEQEQEQKGGVFNAATTSGLTKDFIKRKQTEITSSNKPNESEGIDEVYEQLLNKVQSVDNTVNSYASKYGILKLEKEHDLEGDIQIIPEPAIAGLADVLFTASEGVILPEITQDTLQKIKVPFRTIVTGIYLVLDIIRLSAGVMNINILRKVMSIIVALVELLRGEWKKAILTFIGYYGMTPMIFSQVIKVFVSMFQMLAPQLQEDILLGALDTTKSFLIGILLSVFQVTAPEQIRLPVIGALEKIAQMKAKLDGDLIEAGMSARPNYLSPSFSDLNNIQALFSDEAIICSSEFQQALQPIKQVTILKIILELMRIPTTDDYYKLKCGNEPPKPFVQRLGEEAVKRDKSLQGRKEGQEGQEEEKEGKEQEKIKQEGGNKRILRAKSRKTKITS
jgi:hypothetical protein